MSEVAVGLSAVVVAVTADEPRVLLVQKRGAVAALPQGRLEPQRDRTLELALRAPGEQSPFSNLDAKLVAPPAPAARKISVELHSLRPWRLAPIDPSLAALGEIATLFDGELDGTIADETDELALEVRLSGGHGTLRDAAAVRTVGSYWPYATTLFDYIRRAMPYTEPQSLTADEVYALTAYVLFLNEVVGEREEMNATTLPKVKMPNRDNFVSAYEEPKRGR